MTARITSTSLPRVAIVDPTCQRGYAPVDLERGALGGTEATVIRVTRHLSDRYEFLHYQNGRHETAFSQMGRLSPRHILSATHDVDMIIVLNAWKVAVKLRKAFPDKPIFLWLHIFPGRHNRRMGATLAEARITVVCVSRTHVSWMQDFLRHDALPKLTHIYNPVSDTLLPDDTVRDTNRLLFASSPHKGLKQVFSQFDTLRKSLPRLTLAVADPGYLRWDCGPAPENVVWLGRLTHHALIRQMRRSLCLFYPQTEFAETFGLVMAEANAVGTPVLVHRDIGANHEIVSDPCQLIDGQDDGVLKNRILEWQDGAPAVNADPRFRLTNVSANWNRLIADALTSDQASQQGMVA